jgi:NDP-sugar pyrophosphorylase family protein
MLHWVLKLAQGTYDSVTIICRDEHLRQFSYMQKEIHEIAPSGKIVTINRFQKLGPVHDILEAKDAIDDEHPVLISYCDYYMHWQANYFMQKLMDPVIAGAIPCYTGFHPHLLWKKNLYASCKVDKDYNLIELREKYSWSSDKEKTLHSPGLYFFRSGKMMKHYFRLSIESKDEVNGEYYVSMPFNHMVKDGLKVWCPPVVSHFCQWGTPSDLDEYLRWQTVLDKKEGMKSW